MTDRTVHASYPGVEIVRYNRAGKWYLERVDSSLLRWPVTIDQAVRAALVGRREGGGRIFTGLPGGARFDAKVKVADDGQ